MVCVKVLEEADTQAKVPSQKTTVDTNHGAAQTGQLKTVTLSTPRDPTSIVTAEVGTGEEWGVTDPVKVQDFFGNVLLSTGRK